MVNNQGIRILVTGGAGFIGSAVIRYLIEETIHEVINVDKLTYAGNLESLLDVFKNDRYNFEKVDICESKEIKRIFEKYSPQIVMHLAAESHVDRSINSPDDFIQTNIYGTYIMLESSRHYFNSLNDDRKKDFRFHHISTDEVYGSLDETGLFTEETAYDPSSPYSASKAASDHIAMAWHRTYGLPVLITNCSNNYGPYQFPEKLIPLIIHNALKGKPLPIYGKGEQVRDWLYVEDHARALYQVIQNGTPGEVYNVGGHNEKTNLEVVKTICGILDELMPQHPPGISRYDELISHVKDRPGHDQRYAIDANKIKQELGWAPKETFETGIRKTITWYLENNKWVESVASHEYKNWMETNYTKRGKA